MTKRSDVLDSLRRRIRRGILAGSLRAGDRLPSARQYAAEFGVDFRVVLAAYHTLATEGLIELRPRGGIYVAAPRVPGTLLALSEEWLVDVFTEARLHDIPMRAVAEQFRRCAETLRLHAAVIAGSTDQLVGLCKELEEDYQLESEPVEPSQLLGATVPAGLERAELLVTTEAHAPRVRSIAHALGKTCIEVTLRTDLVSGEWRLLLRRPAYLVVEDARFAEVAHRFFATIPEARNLRILMVHEDDLSTIPVDAPVYVTRSARAALRGRAIPGRLIPPMRMLSSASARSIVAFIVRQNLRVLGVRAAAESPG